MGFNVCVFCIDKDLGHKQSILSYFVTRTCLAVLLFLFLFSSWGLNLTFVCLMWLLNDLLCESCAKNKEINKINDLTKSTKWKWAKMKQNFKAISKILRNVFVFFCVASKKLLTFGPFPQNTWSSYELWPDNDVINT